jgi:hypothetical protein
MCNFIIFILKEFVLGCDFRITPTTDLRRFEYMLKQWEKEVSQIIGDL